jgi:hypothetical protein
MICSIVEFTKAALRTDVNQIAYEYIAKNGGIPDPLEIYGIKIKKIDSVSTIKKQHRIGERERALRFPNSPVDYYAEYLLEDWRASGRPLDSWFRDVIRKKK